MSEIVDVWRKATAEWIKPDTQVWAVRSDGLLFDYGYTSEDSMRKNCWWFKDRNDLKVESMPFREFLKQHLLEVQGMNPFYTLGRFEFLSVYRGTHEEDLF
jgi:CubicO group peptidase (beta-lactamase class C family)